MEFGTNELKPLYKLDGEEYKKQKVRETWKNNGLAILGFCLIAGVITVGMMILAVSRSKMVLAGLFYGGVFLLGMGAYIFLWIRAIKRVKNKKYDAIYEGVAQVIVEYPLTVQYLKPNGTKVTSQVDLKDQKAVIAGRFIKIVVEDETIVKVVDEVLI